jgi:hypothetical protein
LIPNFIFEKIVDDRTSKNRDELKCRWKDINIETWEPKKSLPLKLVQSYEKEKKTLKRKREEEKNEGSPKKKEKTKKNSLLLDEEEIENLSPISKQTEDPSDQEAVLPEIQTSSIVIEDEIDISDFEIKIVGMKKIDNQLCVSLALDGEEKRKYVTVEKLKRTAPEKLIDFLISKLHFSPKNSQ